MYSTELKKIYTGINILGHYTITKIFVCICLFFAFPFAMYHSWQQLDQEIHLVNISPGQYFFYILQSMDPLSMYVHLEVGNLRIFPAMSTNLLKDDFRFGHEAITRSFQSGSLQVNHYQLKVFCLRDYYCMPVISN